MTHASLIPCLNTGMGTFPQLRSIQTGASRKPSAFSRKAREQTDNTGAAEKVKADPGMVQGVRQFTGLPDAQRAGNIISGCA